MALRALRNWLCSCGQVEQETDPNVIQDETSRLIPDVLSSPSSPTSPNHRRLQERLGTIVRAKERKMVNVGSQIPFNLHNQPLPPDFHHKHRRHLLPQSASSSGYFDDSIDDEYTENNRYINYEQDPYPPTPYPQFLSSSPRVYGATAHGSRSPSPDREPRTILNVRLVGFSDRRGRSTQRKNFDGDGMRDHTPQPSQLPRDSSNDVASQDILKLHETGAIVLSWGD